MDGSRSELGLCALHPDRRAIGTCERCGNFYCGDCYKDLADRRLCASCLLIPGVDYISDMRARYSGRRDGWIWYFGLFGGIATLATLVQGITQRDFLQVISSSGSMPILVGYFLQKRWARKALFWTLPLAMLHSYAPPTGKAAANAAAYLLGLQLGGALIGLLFTLAAYTSTRNKLAFRIDVSDHELSKLHERTSNGMAKRSFAYGALSLVIPLLGFVSFALGVGAFRRARPNAWPPIGGKGMAIAGMALSVLSTAIWAVVLFGLLRSR